MRVPDAERLTLRIPPLPAQRKIAAILSAYGDDWGSDETTESEACPVTIIRGTDFDEVHSGANVRAPVRYISERSLRSRILRPG